MNFHTALHRAQELKQILWKSKSVGKAVPYSAAPLPLDDQRQHFAIRLYFNPNRPPNEAANEHIAFYCQTHSLTPKPTYHQGKIISITLTKTAQP